jgi:hypothetical protein
MCGIGGPPAVGLYARTRVDGGDRDALRTGRIARPRRGEVEAYLAWVLEQAGDSVNLFTEDAAGG